MLVLTENFHQNLLDKSKKLLSEIPPDLKNVIPPNSWITKAQENLKIIIKVNEIRKRWLKFGVDMSPVPTKEQIYEMSASVLELDNLCSILEWRKK